MKFYSWVEIDDEVVEAVVTLALRFDSLNRTEGLALPHSALTNSVWKDDPLMRAIAVEKLVEVVFQDEMRGYLGLTARGKSLVAQYDSDLASDLAGALGC
jgi:hypothetical protein